MTGGDFVDLSHPLEAGQPYFPTHAQYFRMMWNRLEDGDRSAHAQIVLGEHAGTHVDAPCHFIASGSSVDRIPLDRFVGSGVVLDLSHLGPGETAGRSDLEWAMASSRSQLADQVVLLSYGWDRQWRVGPHRREYTHAWPGLSRQGATFLVEERAKAVGTDAISMDASGAPLSPAHQVLLGADLVIYENLTNLGCLLERRFDFFGVPLAIGQGTGSPVRAFAYCGGWR